MAKLSANGTEVARFVRRRERNDGNVLRDVTWLSMRSNGKVLRKHQAVIIDVYNLKGFRLVTRGWKVWEEYDQPTVEAMAARYKVYGFEVVS